MIIKCYINLDLKVVHDIEIETCFLNWKFNLRPTLIYGGIQINIEIEKYFAVTILLSRSIFILGIISE